MLYQRSLEIERRLETVLRLIRSGDYSTPKIAEQLGVSIPTVSRDVTALRERGHNNALLQLMEEYDAPGLLVATTNIESSLDQALFRRFDDVFQIPLPGRGEIEQLLRMTLSAVQLAEPINWTHLVERLAEASAAMVVKAAQDAAKAAVLGGKRIVTEAHLQQAIAELRKADSPAPKE